MTVSALVINPLGIKEPSGYPCIIFAAVTAPTSPLPHVILDASVYTLTAAGLATKFFIRIIIVAASSRLIGFSGFIVPVSYTHLRAHETRHDLVCRLLLEKKKKKQNQM